MRLVESDGPRCGCPGPHEQQSVGRGRELCQERAADAAALMRRPNIRVADQRDIAHLLKPHHADENTLVIAAPELDTGSDFGEEVRTLHVRLVPAVGWDDAAVGGCGLVDDGVHRRNVSVSTAADHRTSILRSRQSAVKAATAANAGSASPAYN